MVFGLWSTPSLDPVFELDTNGEFVALFYVYGPLFAVLAPGLLVVGARVVRNEIKSWTLVVAAQGWSASALGWVPPRCRLRDR